MFLKGHPGGTGFPGAVGLPGVEGSSGTAGEPGQNGENGQMVKSVLLICSYASDLKIRRTENIQSVLYQFIDSQYLVDLKLIETANKDKDLLFRFLGCYFFLRAHRDHRGYRAKLDERDQR